LKDLPFDIFSRENSLGSILGNIRRQYQKGLAFAVVDYLQLTEVESRSKGQNREQVVSEISRAFKNLTLELRIPIIALSQLSRAVEIRGGSKRPQLSDLRESGSLEQDADIVAFLYRPEYYNILEDETGQSLKGKAEILVEKNRNGALGDARCDFNFKAGFYDAEPDRTASQFPAAERPHPARSREIEPEMEVGIAAHRPNHKQEIPF
jgi:replicative DNA helicase